MDELEHWAKRQPERAACIFPDTGERLSFAELARAPTGSRNG